MTVRWLAEHAYRGEITFRIGCDGDDVIADWIGLVRLVARRDGSASRLEVVPGADRRAVQKVERGSARLLLRHLTGGLALHGAAVQSRGSAVVFLGRSGDGKSTLAAWLCARTSATLLADDAVAIDETLDDRGEPLRGDGASRRWVVVGAERDHWLDAVARAAIGFDEPSQEGQATRSLQKVPVQAARAFEGAAPLAALVALAFSDVRLPRLTRIRGVDALAALVPQAVRFVLEDPALQRRELDTLAALVESVPMFRLERPRDLALLEAAASLVNDALFVEEKDPPS